MRLPDYHVHTARCGHARGEMREYVERALALGLVEIGFADHMPMYWLDETMRDPGVAMSFEEMPRYVEEVQHLRAMYPQIPVRLGIEADFVPGFEDCLQQVLDTYPFDYVIGSVHFIEGWGFDNPGFIDRYHRCDIDELYGKYFRLLQQAAESGLFNVMAHPDLIKKFGYRPRGCLEGLYEETARTLARSGVCLEVNTAGLRVPAKEIYPAPGLLKACLKHGVPVTTGSDAHEPGQVGWEFEQAGRLLADSGYKTLVLFEGTKKKTLPIYPG